MIDANKIIHGVVGGGRYTVTSPIVKEDYGLYLKIEGLELPSTYEVDFSNSEHNGTSVTMIGNADGVLIPSQFISSGKDVFAFLYHVGVDFGRTVYKFRIPNKCRPERTNEEPTPEEQSVIDQAISALNTAVAQTAQDKADANFCDLVDAIVDNDWTAIDARIAELISGNVGFSSLTTTIGEIKTLDFSTVDYVIIAYGTNDWAENKAIGEPTSTDKSEIYGAMKYAINKLLTAYPQLRVYFVSPGYRRDTGNTETDTHNGKTLAEYSADIAKASNSMGFPCLNLYNEGMVNRYNYAYFLADSVHRNIKGYELLARQFCNFIQSR